MTTSHTDTMDFPLPIRSVTTVDYFTPLHVDTNIEYTLDMEKFPELTDPLHYWEPALVMDSHSYLLPDLSLINPEFKSSPQDLALNGNHEELLGLLDTYAIGDLQKHDLDFGFVDLAPSIPQYALEATGFYLESSLTCGLSADSVLSTPDLDDSGFASETDEGFPEETAITSKEVPRCGFSERAGWRKRKRSVSDMYEGTQTPATVCKRGRLLVNKNTAENSFS